MKMTRLEWRYLQRIALDHPYFDTHKLPLTEKEAKAIVETNNRMTGKEFVDSIYAKLGMTRPQEEKKRFAWLHNIGELFTVPPIRRIAIAVLVVVLMTVFFTATPTGRAIAESVIQYIATLFDDGRLIVNRSDNEEGPYAIAYDGFMGDDIQNPEDITAHGANVASVEEFSEMTGKTPIVLPLPYSSLYYEYDDELDYFAFYATYDTQSGKIISYQIWDADDMESITTTGYQALETDETIYYSIEDKEALIHCKMVLDDSVLTISFAGDYTLDEIIKMLKEK